MAKSGFPDGNGATPLDALHMGTNSRGRAEAQAGRTPRLRYLLLHSREAGRLQERIDDLGDDRPVFLGLGARLMPFRIGLERIPLLLAIGQRVEFEQVIERLVR